MKLIVLNNPVPGAEDAFRTWVDEVHLPQLRDIPGVASATRYEPEWPAEGHEYASMTVYDLDGDVQAVLAEMGRRRKEGLTTPSDSLDMERVSIVAWRPVVAE
jgi:hypothetical protein